MQLAHNTVVATLLKQIKSVPAFGRQHFYVERVDQSLVRPCFFINQILLSQEKQMLERYRRTYRMRIKWLPPLDDPYPDDSCRQVGETLLAALRYVRFDDRPVRPIEMEYEVVDQELRFSIELVIHAQWPPEEIPDMQTLTTNEHVKYDERSD